MNIGRLAPSIAGAAGVLLMVPLALGAAAQTQQSGQREPQMQPSTPSEVHTRCEHLAGQDRTDCERRMMDRMRNSSDATRTDDPTVRDRRGRDDSKASSEMRRERATRERSDRTRIGRRDTDERARERANADSKDQEVDPSTDTAGGSDTLRQDRPPSSDGEASQSRPESMQRDRSVTQKESEESDTLEPKRDDNGSTDTESPR